jgi:hypothetical protein
MGESAAAGDSQATEEVPRQHQAGLAGHALGVVAAAGLPGAAAGPAAAPPPAAAAGAVKVPSAVAAAGDSVGEADGSTLVEVARQSTAASIRQSTAVSTLTSASAAAASSPLSSPSSLPPSPRPKRRPLSPPMNLATAEGLGAAADAADYSSNSTEEDQTTQSPSAALGGGLSPRLGGEGGRPSGIEAAASSFSSHTRFRDVSLCRLSVIHMRSWESIRALCKLVEIRILLCSLT